MRSELEVLAEAINSTRQSEQVQAMSEASKYHSWKEISEAVQSHRRELGY